MLRGLTIGVIGAGTMGQALIGGLLARGMPRNRLRAADVSVAARRATARRFRIAVTDDVLKVVRQSDVLVLAVKPQQFPQLIAQAAPAVHRRQLVISIAAGMTLRWLQARLPGVAVVRVMPNLPATVGAGFAVVAPGRAATAAHRAIAVALFGTVGRVCVLPERHLDAITAVSGSGPAYVFFLVDAWEQAAKALGLPSELAVGAIQQTLEGSARLLASSRQPVAVLIRRVASKGGTTEAALKVLATQRVSRAFASAVRAAAQRSKALAWS